MTPTASAASACSPGPLLISVSHHGKANPPPARDNFNTARTEETTNTWLTPLSLIQALGTFDLDPCCPPVMPWRTAAETHHYPDIGCGLSREWHERSFINPPSGEHTFKWMHKFAEHKRGIALILARTGTKGFHEHVFSSARAIYFLKGRLGSTARKAHFRHTLSFPSLDNRSRQPGCRESYHSDSPTGRVPAGDAT